MWKERLVTLWMLVTAVAFIVWSWHIITPESWPRCLSGDALDAMITPLGLSVGVILGCWRKLI